MASLRPGGRAVVVFPDGIFFRSGAEKQLRERLLSEFYVEGVLALPPRAFTPFTGLNSNLLNIIAKCGVTPWVLPDALPDADFFVGLSYTQSRRSGTERLMGYANVFNHYGRWEFYSGNTEIFTYDDRVKHFKELIQQTFTRLNLQTTPHIYFHYSAKFSRDDRTAILEAA